MTDRQSALMGYVFTLYNDPTLRKRISDAGTSATALLRIVGVCVREDIGEVAASIGKGLLERGWQMGTRVATDALGQALGEMGARLFGARK